MSGKKSLQGNVCWIAKLPIKYLGISLGANPRSMKTWEPIIQRFKEKATWKAKILSHAGRLQLVKSVLNNIPMYYLGIFRMPKKVQKRLIQIQRRIFWAGNGEKRGIPLIKWEIVQKAKSMGGLGVGDMALKNAAMLFR